MIDDIEDIKLSRIYEIIHENKINKSFFDQFCELLKNIDNKPVNSSYKKENNDHNYIENNWHILYKELIKNKSFDQNIYKNILNYLQYESVCHII